MLKCGHPEEEWNLIRGTYATGKYHKGLPRRYCRMCNTYKAAVHAARRGGYAPPIQADWEILYTKVAKGEAECAVPFGRHGGHLCVDHDHETGRVRGAVCVWHNRNVLPFLESVDGDWTQAQAWAQEYLRTEDKRYPGVKFKGVCINVWGSPKIGPGTTIGAFTEIGDDVEIGENCAIGAMVFLPPGIRIRNNVFIGPRATLTNDKMPRARNTEYKQQVTVVEEFASIGAAAVILPGVTIGRGALVGAGTVVTKDVEAGTVVAGVPARTLRSKEWGHELTRALTEAGHDRLRALGWPEEDL